MLNEISKWIILLIVFVIMCIYIKKDFEEFKKNRIKQINSVELHTRYKKYIVLEKYPTDSLYILKLQNPLIKDVSSVAVSEWIYYNLYFVGDTIK